MGDFSVSKPLHEVSTFLDNYWNRDQVFRTIQYASTLCSGALEPRLPAASARFGALAGSVASMRTTLRLLDDIPNLASTLARWRRPKVCALRAVAHALILHALETRACVWTNPPGFFRRPPTGGRPLLSLWPALLPDRALGVGSGSQDPPPHLFLFFPVELLRPLVAHVSSLHLPP